MAAEAFVATLKTQIAQTRDIGSCKGLEPGCKLEAVVAALTQEVMALRATAIKLDACAFAETVNRVSVMSSKLLLRWFLTVRMLQ